MSSHGNQSTSVNPQPTTFKKSLLAMCIIALHSPAFAQVSPAGGDEIVEEVTITGLRQNLESAQALKRDASTFVDSITANDIGSLPDRSVLEAMQRLPGVSVERFAAANDPDHFSVEGSGAAIRGMSATRSEFNGRDSFTAGPGRALSFQDVPPELMAGVDIYKNQTADMIEGGIGGTVSLRTRKPFDAKGRVIAFNADGTWGDIAEEWKPSVSGMFSDRWEASAGEFGFLINLAHSELTGASHGIQSDVYKKYDAAVIPGAERFVGDGTGIVWMPQGGNMTMKEDQREREGLATSFQWRDNEGVYAVTAEYIRSEASLDWWENALKYQGGYRDADRNTRPYGDTIFTFNDNGLFESGFIAHGGAGITPFRASDNLGPVVGGTATAPIYQERGNTRLPNPYAGSVAGSLNQFGHKFQSDTRGHSTSTLVEDMSLNFRWTPDDAWTIDLDLQHIKADTDASDLVVQLGVAALQQYDLSGSAPELTLINPWNGVRDANPTTYNNGITRPGWTNDPAGDSNYFSDITSYWYRSAIDSYERADGTSDAIRLDVKHEFENAGLIKSVKGGYRFAERDQTRRATGYVWGSIAPEFNDGTLYLDHVPDQSGYYELVDWSDFRRGDGLNIEGGNALYALKRDVVADLRDNPDCDGSRLQKSAAGTFTSHGCRVGVDDRFGLFLPQDITDTVETNNAAYVRVDFGSDETPYRFSGNVGLRYVQLERSSTGYVSAAGLDESLTAADAIPAGSGLPSVLTGTQVLAYADTLIADGQYANYTAFYNANAWARQPYNYLPEEDRRYGQQGAGWNTATDTYETVLPSINLKVELTDELIGRAAISQAIALPDMSLVHNQIAIDTDGYAIDERSITDPNNNAAFSYIESASVNDWIGSGGNTYLQPMESTQYDLSLEWYFSTAGSLTATVFYKDLSNFFIQGASRQMIPHPVNTGEVRAVDVVATRNGGDGTMQGFELGYQQFFDFLPSPFDGFGVQANYTYIDASGVPNNEEDYENADWAQPGSNTDTGARVSLDSIPLQGQSEHTANFVLMYEKYDWSARLAYNWRSKYLLTTRDVISKYPLWNDDAGFLDGSVFYEFNDNFSVGLQATNLLNTESKTIMILDDNGTEAGRSWFIQDRRVSAVLRATF